MAYQAAWFAKKVARSNVPPYQPLMKASPHLREKSPIRQGWHSVLLFSDIDTP